MLKIKLGGPLTLLTIVFFLAKILGYIDWSWWLVLAPTLIPAAIVMCFLAFMFLACLLKVLE